MTSLREDPGAHPGREARKGSGGFSLVEVVVALIILTTGVLGLAATTMYVVRQTTLADVTSDRAFALQSVVEQLRASDYASLTDGTDSVSGYQVKWSVLTGQRSKEVTIVTLGPGLRSNGSGLPGLGASVADTFVYRIPER